MTAWWSLTRKELRLGLPIFLIPIIAFLLLAGILGYVGNRNGVLLETLVGLSIFATGAQIFYLVFYLIGSLGAEMKKMHLWLHNPQPAYALLLAKLVAGLISMVITFLMTGATFFFVSLNLMEKLQVPLPSSAQITEIAVWGSIHIFLLAISFAIGFIFFWMIFLLFTRSLGTFLSFVLTFIVFIVYMSLFMWFADTAFYEMLTSWGAIDLTEMMHSWNFTTNLQTGGTDIVTETGVVTFYLGTYVLETVIALVLFSLSCWILDRKVEV